MRELKARMSPSEILETFKVGNQRFLEGKPKYRDQLGDVKRTALGQTPRAIVLGCIDSRKPAEVIFDRGLGDCGAVKAAVDDIQLGNITPMLANLKPAVVSVTEIRGRATSEDQSFVADVAKENVLHTMKKIVQDSPIIAELVENGEVKIAGCMYDLRSGVVEFYD